MNGKRLIDLSITGGDNEVKRLNHSRTLAPPFGGPRPRQVSMNRQQSSRLTSSSERLSRNAPSRTLITLSSANGGSYKAVPSLFSSRVTSAVGRSVSTTDKGSSETRCISSFGTKSLSSVVYRLSRETTDSRTDTSTRLTGLTIWRLENDVLCGLNDDEHGFFHQADCYLVYQSNLNGSSCLHVWTGSLSQEESCDAVKLLAEELDKSLSGATFMSLEYEGHETTNFLRHFQDGIVIVEGKSKQVLGRVVKYVKNLYKVQGRTYLSAICVERSVKAATVNDVLILDVYPRMYVWVGQQVDFVLRVQAIKLAKKMRMQQRNGKAHIIVVDQSNKEMSDAFLKKLDNDSQCDLDTKNDPAGNMAIFKPLLYKVNGDRVLYDMPLTTTQPSKQKYLTTTDSFLLDMGPSCPLYIWVGNYAVPEALYNALHCAENFKQYYSYPRTTPVCRITEGNEPVSFKRTFIDWKDRVFRSRQTVNTCHFSSIDPGKARCSKTDSLTNAKLNEDWRDNDLLMKSCTVEIWQLQENTQELLPQEQLGVFYNNHCYIILYRENMPQENQYIIYTWKGREANKEQHDQTQKIALSMDSILEHKATIIRVLDGKEPEHFLSALQSSIIVYDVHLGKDALSGENINKHSNNISMFCVQEVASECVRIFQVPPVFSSLNSSAAYVILSNHIPILWYGKKSSAYEREYSKYILAYFCPERLHVFDIILDGKESKIFWSLVQRNEDYPKQYLKHKLSRNFPILAMSSRKLERWSFIDIPDFTQEDLCERYVFILDANDLIQIWIGSSVVDREHETLCKIIQTYINLDPAEREMDDLQLLFCNQGHEPSMFKTCFKSWKPYGYGGEQTYEAARKQLRQENAIIDIDGQIGDNVYMVTQKLSYKDLVKGNELPTDIDIKHKEHYLSDSEFLQALRMARPQFYRLPKWKQHQILKSARIMSHSNDLDISLPSELSNLRL